MKRQIEALLEGVHTKDGAGVRVKRMIGNPKICRLDPFLLFDWFEFDQEDDYSGAYPEHPHRGFDTLIYLTRGKMRHKDFLGNDCELSKGDFTWMSAGKGIVHSETPLPDAGPAAGLHIWINRHSGDKLADPEFVHFSNDTIPVARAPRIEIRVLSGELPDGSRWPKGSSETSPVLLDISQQHSATFLRTMETEDSALVYVVEGKIRIEGELVESGKMAALGSGNRVQIRTDDSEARYLFCSATPLNEPVVRTGPFVMNTREELLHAFRDYQEGWFSQPR